MLQAQAHRRTLACNLWLPSCTNLDDVMYFYWTPGSSSPRGGMELSSGCCRAPGPHRSLNNPLSPIGRATTSGEGHGTDHLALDDEGRDLIPGLLSFISASLAGQCLLVIARIACDAPFLVGRQWNLSKGPNQAETRKQEHGPEQHLTCMTPYSPL